jgi:glycosyltransferase involved in cell wall biosynthesis
MKILAIYRHYSPDTAPYARILRTIVEHLAERGHETTVFTAQPSYNDVRQPHQQRRETLGGVDVRRIRLLPERKRWRLLRIVNLVYFLCRAVWHAAIARRYDLVIANSHPPVIMGCALRAIRAIRGTPYIYHCQDLHPEAAALAGDLERGGLYRRLLRWDAATCRRAHRLVVLSRDMADSIAARGLPRGNVHIINNPPLAIADSVRPMLPPPLDDRIETVRFLFAGNLGRFQGLERLVAAARLIAPRVNMQLIFMGEGSVRSDLIAAAGELLGRRIIFIPHQPVETAMAAMRVCDYGLVSLAANVYRFAYPSKSMMYLSAGCPIVALVERESELAQTVDGHRLGYVASNRSVAGIAETLMKAVAECRLWTGDRRGEIAQIAEQLFGQTRVHAAWDRLIADDEGGQSTNTSIEKRTTAA